MAHDTAPIRREEAFDEARVAAFLHEHLGDVIGDNPIVFDQFPGGAANLTYRAVAGDVELVLRRAPLGPVAKGAHDMQREYRVLSRLWREFPKAPRAFVYCEDVEVMGKPFFVMERRHGFVVRASWPPGFGEDPAVRRRLAGELVATLARLHDVSPADVGLDDLGHSEGFVERQIEGWGHRWDAAKTRVVPAMDEAKRLLRRDVPQAQAVSVLHNDYKLDNTMVSAAGDVVAVFDWDMATRGDPLVDLGTLLAYWADPDGPTYPVFGERAVTLTPYMTKTEVTERYAARSDLDLSGVHYYEGLALYRIAVIIEQIYGRYLAGQTSDPRFARFEPIPALLAEAAVEVLWG